MPPPVSQVNAKKLINEIYSGTTYSQLRTRITSSLSTSNLVGLVGDKCVSASECKDPRRCTCGRVNCNCEVEPCICFQTKHCSSNAMCTKGEVCTYFEGESFCLSENWIRYSNKTTVEPLRPGLTKDSCLKTPDCFAPRECVDKECIPKDGLQSCKAQTDCRRWEFCVRSPINGKDVCVSARFYMTTSQDWKLVIHGSIAPTPTPKTTSSPAPEEEVPDWSEGVNSDFCKTTNDCKGDRLCLFVGEAVGGLGHCFPPRGIPECREDHHCDEKEVCVYISKTRLCLSKGMAEFVGWSAEPGTQDGPGLTFDICEENENCIGSRICMVAGPKITSDKDKKVCKPMENTSNCKEEGCVEGERCINIEGLDICVSEKAIAKFSLNEACVAVHHLNEEGIIKSQRVFDADRLAVVLCDENNSCATPGHMVSFRGKGMMMRSYCKLIECTQSIMRVNSPIHSRKMRVTSRSEGLVFTAFAAKWVTAFEERVLWGLIRMGF